MNGLPSKILIISEVGSTHDGSFGIAKNLIKATADCGADSVKFQTHIAEAETLKNAPMPPYFKGEPRYEYFKRTAFTRTQWEELKLFSENLGLDFLSSPFSLEAVALLEDIGIKKYKIPSGEVTNVPLLEETARTGKPVLLSSGMSSWDDLDRAVNTILKHHDKIVVMQCTSEYPCPYKEVGLNVMQEMRERYQLPVGLSDHTLTNYASYTAASLGAVVIEKHFTLSRRMYGSDAQHSLEPDQMSDMVNGIRAIEVMLTSKVNKNDSRKFSEMKNIFEKSIVSIVEIPADTLITQEMIGYKKPGTGIPAADSHKVLGRVTARFIDKNSLIQETDLQADQ